MMKNINQVKRFGGTLVVLSVLATFSPSIALGYGGGSVILPQFFGIPTNNQEVLGASTVIADPANLAKYGLKEGNLIRAVSANDPDVYIVNGYGYKRLILNPVIFSFYGNLGGYRAVKAVTAEARDSFPTSGLVRNCEARDPKVYAMEVTGEDAAVLHWVNMTSEASVAQDANFFKKTFCINNNEFNWYPQSETVYTSLSQVPTYRR